MYNTTAFAQHVQRYAFSEVECASIQAICDQRKAKLLRTLNQET